MSNKKNTHQASSEIHVVGAIDDNMVYPLLVWASSLIQSAQRPVRFTIGFLSGTLSADNREQLHLCLTHLGANHLFHELPFDPRFIAQGHISPTTFAKFLLAEETLQPHVWIDADAVGLRGWDSILDDSGAQNSPSELFVAARDEGSLEKPGAAFNAGILAWPAGERRPWSERLDTMDLVETQEQQLFNELYGDVLGTVSSSYNVLSYRVDSLREIGHQPRILHFAGPHKPWQLPGRYRVLCQSHACPWSLWFSAEALMLSTLESGPLRAWILKQKRAATRPSGLPLDRASRGKLLLWCLSIFGPAGWLIVILAKPFAARIPSGTHPLH